MDFMSFFGRYKWTIPLFLLVLIAGTSVVLADRTPIPQNLTNYTDYPKITAYFEQYIQSVGPKKTQEAYLALANTLTTKEAHILAHGFGDALYKKIGTAGLSYCTDDFNYGCFHQFLGSAIANQGLSAAQSIYSSCEVQKTACRHSIGHGLVGYLGYSLSGLTQALDMCNTMSKTDNHNDSCLYGAFMEYDLRYLALFESPDAEPLALSKGEFGPCYSVETSYQKACMFLLPLWWSKLTTLTDLDGQFKEYGGRCAKITDPTLREACFEGIGYVAAFADKSDPSSASRLCADAASDEPEKSYCATGVSQRLRGEAFIETIQKSPRS